MQHRTPIQDSSKHHKEPSKSNKLMDELGKEGINDQEALGIKSSQTPEFKLLVETAKRRKKNSSSLLPVPDQAMNHDDEHPVEHQEDDKMQITSDADERPPIPPYMDQLIADDAEADINGMMQDDDFELRLDATLRALLEDQKTHGTAPMGLDADPEITLDKDPIPQASLEEAHTDSRGMRVMPVPQWHAMKPNPSSTPDPDSVPDVIRGITLDYVDGDVVGETKEYPLTNRSRFTFFNQTDLPVTALLEHVVHGELKEAKAMLDKNPCLVLYSGQVTDYSGRRIQGTAYQIALGADDVSREGHPEEGMADMILPYYTKALGDEKLANEEISKHFKEQFPEAEFPEYYEVDEAKRVAMIQEKEAKDPVLKELEKVAHAILRADAEEIKAIPTGTQDQYGWNEYKLTVTGECAKALQAFRDYLQPQAVIKKGKHFNIQFLVKAFEKYVGKQYDLFGGHWNDPKNILFWRQVIGYIERYLTANLAQAICQGLGNVIDRGQSLGRNLKLDDESFFFPSDFSSSSGLGFDHSGFSYYAGERRVARLPPASLPLGLLRLWKLMSSKNNSLSFCPMQLIEERSKKNVSCVIL